MSDLVLYKDRQFKTPFAIEDLGDVQAGDIRILEGYLYNSTQDDILKIEYEVDDKDVELLNIPSSLKGGGWDKIQIRYAPNEVRTVPLNTFVTLKGIRRIPPE